MSFGLDEKTIKKIRGVFALYPQVESAVLYGSRAKGNYRPGSDIDLALTGDGLDLSLLQKIEWELDELLLPYRIDLFLLGSIENAQLLEHIRRVGKSFYRADLAGGVGGEGIG